MRKEEYKKMRQMKRGSSWTELINEDVPIRSFDEESFATTKRESERFRGSARFASGRVLTNAQYEAKRAAVLRKPLP
jgi:hypothetical protein